MVVAEIVDVKIKYFGVEGDGLWLILLSGDFEDDLLQFLHLN